jgi:hypothetical protein
MFCPPDVNTGFIELVGPIQQPDLNTITVKSYPLSISFKQRTTIPSLLGNRIDESTENTCTYRGQRFSLVDVQICSVLSKGYILPGITTQPVAELVLSFSVNSTNNTTASAPLSGILLCVPIYDSGTPNHNEYLDRIIDPDNKTYVDADDISKSPIIPNLESIFYGWKGDTTQTSFSYMTCFETMNNKTNLPTGTRSLYVVVFPHGITIKSDLYQKLRTKLNITNSTPSYSIPASIRGGDSTLKSYKFNDKGNKVPTIISTDGYIYSSQLSTSTDEFRHRIIYYTLPPRSNTSGSKWNSEQCPYYKTNQYKCVPFNQAKDLSGNLVVPGNKTLDTVLSERDQAQKNANSGDSSSPSLTTEQIEGIIAGVAGIAIVTVLFLKAGDWISKNA